MIPLTENPTVVVLLENGKVTASATNVAPDLNIVFTDTRADFDDAAANKPFNSLVPVAPQQVLAHKH